MTVPHADLVAYCGCLEEIKGRIAVVRAIAERRLSTARAELDAEIACLQVRKSLELLVFASLTANRRAYEQVHNDITSAWSAKRILRKLETIHPEFFPRAVTFGHEDAAGVKHFALKIDGCLTVDEFVTLYDRCSAVVHAWNPHRVGPRRIEFGRPIAQWCDRILGLLDMHYFQVPGDSSVYLAYLNHPSDGKAHVLTGTVATDAAG